MSFDALDLFGAPPDDAPGGRWDPAIGAGLAAMLRETTGRAIAAFDWDETCIRGDISETWLTWLDEADPRPLLAEYEEGCRTDKYGAYVKLAIDLCYGKTEREVRAGVLGALARGLDCGRLALRPEMRELIWQLHRHGWEVWVVTASPTAVVQPLAERYGIHPHRVLGMQATKGPDGRYEARLREPVTFRDGKLDALVRYAGAPPTFAAGDSEGDLGLLRAARYRLLVDRGERGDPALRAHAQSEGWWLQRGWS